VKARGTNGQIELDGKRLVIRRKGLLAAMSQDGAPENKIPVSQVRSVEFQSASLFRSGYFRLVVEGENEPGSGLWKATRDPYAVMFKIGRQQRGFKELREALEKSMRKQARRK
jgi:hypothetical protein